MFATVGLRARRAGCGPRRCVEQVGAPLCERLHADSDIRLGRLERRQALAALSAVQPATWRSVDGVGGGAAALVAAAPPAPAHRLPR
eukprot:986924-Prymnesium_polylepis.1